MLRFLKNAAARTGVATWVRACFGIWSWIVTVAIKTVGTVISRLVTSFGKPTSGPVARRVWPGLVKGIGVGIGHFFLSVYYSLVFLFAKKWFRFTFSLVFLLIINLIFREDSMITTAYCQGSSEEQTSSSSLVLPQESASSSSDRESERSMLGSLTSSAELVALTNYHNTRNLFHRISMLEAELAFGIPPQSNPGEYQRLVQEILAQSVNYNGTLNQEFFCISMLEYQAQIQDAILNLILQEPEVAQILDISPYGNNLREAIFDYIRYRIEPVLDMNTLLERHIMEQTLTGFVNDLQANGAQSAIYQQFRSHFTNEEQRRLLGLPTF